MQPEVKFEMVPVEGGTFNMGSNNDTEMEKPVHSVTLGSYQIGKYEVTQQQWADIMGKNPAKYSECPQCPVESISWNDILDFLQKLNSLSGKKYRLPTEAEWEFAARGGKKSIGYTYSGSNKAEEVAWLGLNSTSKTHPVGEKKQNELGIYDMSGNLYEWCSDFYDETYYSRSPANNPVGAAKGSFKILRGGCWISPASSCDVTSRRRELPNPINDMHGFRLGLSQ
jgi:formylglycine-generating enzyme required for sulfatase activity